jgi:hypothetical protein
MHKLLPLLIVGAIVVITVSVVSNGLKSQNLVGEAVLGRNTEIGKKYLGNSIEKLQQVEAKVKTKEEKAKVESVLQDTVEADMDIDTHIASMEARPSVVKFIMGPDYKNAGQVRSTIVHLENDIKKLDKVEEKTGTGSGTVSDTKVTLQSELTAIETKLSDNLQGFSLFGWLSKLLSGFVPTPTATPVPSLTPDASASASPVATLLPSSSPSATPTLLPTASP